MSHLSMTKRLTAHEESVLLRFAGTTPNPWGDGTLGLFLEKIRIEKTPLSKEQVQHLDHLLSQYNMIPRSASGGSNNG